MRRTRGMFCNVFKISIIVICFVAVSALGANYVFAEAPNGSYKKTCKNINYNASADRITSASCKKMNGKWITTQYHNCNGCINQGGDISNCDGTLECTGVNLPNVGSYQRSCFCCKMVGSTLGCYCKPKKGTSKWTTLSNASNYSDIWNDNGKLKGQ